jgi:hypothetical protein
MAALEIPDFIETGRRIQIDPVSIRRQARWPAESPATWIAGLIG